MYEMSVELILLLPFSCFMGSKGNVVVRAFASHQCGPGSNPGVDARHRWVEFVVGSLPSPRVFSPGTPVFPSPQKPTFPYSNSTRNQVDKEPQCGNTALKKSALYLSVNVFRRKY